MLIQSRVFATQDEQRLKLKSECYLKFGQWHLSLQSAGEEKHPSQMAAGGTEQLSVTEMAARAAMMSEVSLAHGDSRRGSRRGSLVASPPISPSTSPRGAVEDEDDDDSSTDESDPLAWM